MSTPDFSPLVARHRAYFRTGATRSTVWREGQLTALRDMMTERAEDFHAALWTDLRRNRTDADLTDVKFLATEAEHQGQRSLNRCSSKDFQHVVLVPTAAATFHDETRAVRILLQE